MTMRAARNLLAAGIAGFALAAAPAPVVKFSPVEAYTVVYMVTGPQSGNLTQHSRKFGLEQSAINDLSLGNNARNRVQLMTMGDRIISYDPLTRRAGSTNNPGYQQLLTAATGTPDAELSNALLRALGFAPSGRMQTFLGETCLVWESQQLMQSRCVTPDGINLQTRITLPGATTVQTVRTIRRGDPGPESAYSVPQGTQVMPVASMRELPGVGR
jgi:hypothetical protein